MPFPSPSPSPHHFQHSSLPHPCQLPASLPPQVPESPDPLRYLRDATQSAATLFNTQGYRHSGWPQPTPLQGPPPQSRQPTPTWVSLYTQAASLLQPPRVTFLSAPSFCLVLPCLAVPSSSPRRDTHPSSICSIYQPVSHLPRPTQRAPSPILSLLSPFLPSAHPRAPLGSSSRRSCANVRSTVHAK